MVPYSQQVIQQAQELRRQGFTYREICHRLNHEIPKGTLSYWLKNISLPLAYYGRLQKSRITNIQIAQTANKQLLDYRLHTLRAKNIHLIHYIDRSIGKLILATLYWCEGNKYPSSRNLKFGNSDPNMIKLFLALLRSCYRLNESKFRLTLQCRADQDPTSLIHYWARLTQIPPTQHYQSRIDRRSIGKPTLKQHYKGVCVIDYLDTNLQCELQFLGEYLGTDPAIQQMKNQLK